MDDEEIALKQQDKETQHDCNNEENKGNLFRPFSSGSHLISRALWPQVILVMASTIHSLSTSMSASHAAILVPQLKSENNSIVVDDTTASLIASSYAIMGPLGCLTGGIFLDILGRKKTNICGSLGLLSGWLMILAAKSNTIFIIARLIEGFFKGLSNTAVLVTTDETADPNLRGVVVCCAYLAFSTGILIIAVLGAAADWWTTTLISALLPLGFTISCFFLTETPTWLMRKNYTQQARQVLSYLWGNGCEREAEEEFAQLAARFSHHRHTSGVNNIDHNITDKLKKLKQFCNNLLRPNLLKPFLIIHIFNTMQTVCGNGHFLFYSVDILSRARKNDGGVEYSDSFISNVVLSAIRLASTLIACICLFRLGRRKVAYISGLGSTVTALLVSLLLYLNIPQIDPVIQKRIIVTVMMGFIGFYSFGFMFLPTLMIGETQPAEIRGPVTGYIFTINDFTLGIVLQYYYSMVETMGIEGLFLMFALSCLLCTTFVYLFVPETQGKTLLEIEEYFKQKNVLWIKRNKQNYCT